MATGSTAAATGRSTAVQTTGQDARTAASRGVGTVAHPVTRGGPGTPPTSVGAPIARPPANAAGRILADATDAGSRPVAPLRVVGHDTRTVVAVNRSMLSRHIDAVWCYTM
jgi:hypothetical protein